MIDNRELDERDKALLRQMSNILRQYCLTRVDEGFSGPDAVARPAAVVAMGLAMLIGCGDVENLYDELLKSINKPIKEMTE